MVVYVDVLFIVNFFISYMLLGVTQRLIKINSKLYRLILSSAIGGLYSLIILVDNIPMALLLLSKFAIAIVMLTVAFDFRRLSTFLKSFVIFGFVNLLFLGIIVGSCMMLKSQSIVLKNSVVYFDISARSLLVLAFFAYLLSCVVIRFYNKRLSKDEIFTITVINAGKQVSGYAFADTGNKLREPFSNSPVIVARKEKFECFLTEKNTRLIPINTVNDTSLLKAFRADKVIIKIPNSREEVLSNIYVALSDNINSDNYSVILNPDVLHI